MKELPSIQTLIDSFSKLPGVGVKSAERMAYAVLNFKDEDREEFSRALHNLGERVHPCPECGMYTENEGECDICLDATRNHQLVCVVSEVKDIIAIEKMNSFQGVYHVLGGSINLAKGIGAEDLRIASLLKRVQENNIHEVILATSPTIEGETTALFIAKLLEGKANVTRLGYGLPMGLSLDYADPLTLAKAFEGRKKI